MMYEMIESLEASYAYEPTMVFCLECAAENRMYELCKRCEDSINYLIDCLMRKVAPCCSNAERSSTDSAAMSTRIKCLNNLFAKGKLPVGELAPALLERALSWTQRFDVAFRNARPDMGLFPDCLNSMEEYYQLAPMGLCLVAALNRARRAIENDPAALAALEGLNPKELGGCSHGTRCVK